MTTSRTQHRAVLLPDGRVLIAGGNTVGPDGHTLDRELFSAEIFDPATGRFTAVTSAPAGGLGLHLALLQDGRVLALSATKLEFFDPRLGTFVPSSAAPSSARALGNRPASSRMTIPWSTRRPLVEWAVASVGGASSRRRTASRLRRSATASASSSRLAYGGAQARTAAATSVRLKPS